MLQPDQKKKLDSNIRLMLENGASEKDVNAYAKDFSAKYTTILKKKDPTEPSMDSNSGDGSLGLSEGKMQTFTGLKNSEIASLQDKSIKPKINQELIKKINAKGVEEDRLRKKLLDTKVTSENADEISQDTNELSKLVEEKSYNQQKIKVKNQLLKEPNFYEKYVDIKQRTGYNADVDLPKAKQELADELDTNGFMDNVWDVTKKIGTKIGDIANRKIINPINNAIAGSTVNTEVDIAGKNAFLPKFEDTYQKTIPLESQLKKVDQEILQEKKDALKSKKAIPTYTKEEKLERAKELFLKEKTDSYVYSRQKDALQEQQDDDDGVLQTKFANFEEGQLASFEEKEKQLLNVQAVQEGVYTRLLAKKENLEEQIKKQGISPELQNVYNQKNNTLINIKGQLNNLKSTKEFKEYEQKTKSLNDIVKQYNNLNKELETDKVNIEQTRKEKNTTKEKELINLFNAKVNKSKEIYNNYKSIENELKQSTSVIDFNKKQNELNNQYNLTVNDINKIANSSKGKSNINQEYQELQKQLKQIQSEGIATIKEYASNRENIGNATDNLDVFKRNYSALGNLTGNFASSGMSLIGGVFGALDYGFELNKSLTNTITPTSLMLQNLVANTSKSLQQESENLAKTLERPMSVDKINSFSDFGDWIGTTISQQGVNILAASTGVGGIATLAASAGGTKFEEMKTEMSTGEKKYSNFELMTKPLLYAGSEVPGAILNYTLLKNAGRVIASANVPEGRMLAKGMFKGMANYGKPIAEGTISELVEGSGTTMAQNLIDGKPLMTNVKDAASASGAMSFMIAFLASNVKLIKQFTSKDLQIQNESARFEKFQSQLNNPNLDTEAKSILQEQADKSRGNIEFLLKKVIGDVATLSDSQFQEIVNLETEQANIKSKAQKIQFDDNLDDDTKKQVLSNLQDEFNISNQRRLDLLERGANVQLEALGGKEMVRLKDLAGRELMQEQNPDGTANITLNDNKISKRAVQIYKNEVLSKNKAEETILNEQKSKNKTENAVEQPLNETTPTNDTPIDANVSVGDNADLQQQEVEDIQPTNNVGESESYVEVKKDIFNDTETAIAEIKSKNLTRVQGLRMGLNQAIGTYISTEEVNRYGTPEQAKKMDVKIENPLVTNDTGLLETRKQTLQEIKEQFTAEDFELYEIPKNNEITLDDLNNVGIKKLAKITTNKLKSQGYDSVYFPESKNQEGELVVFDREKAVYVTESKNNAEVENNQKNNKIIKTESGSYDVTFDDNQNVKEIKNTKDGKIIPKFVERISKTKIDPKTGQFKKTLTKNANYTKIEADVTGNKTNNAIAKEDKQTFAKAMDNFTPTTEYEVALEGLAKGLKISKESIKKETGNDVKWATNQFSKTELPSIEVLSEKLSEGYPDLDQTKIRNALIDIISSNQSIDDVKNKIIDFTNENSEKLKQQELKVFLGGLSEKDLAIYESVKAEDDYLDELTDQEQQEYFYNQYENQFENEKGTAKNDTSGDKQSNSVQEDNRGTQQETKPTKEVIKEIFNQDNIKDDLDWLDSLKLDANNLSVTLPFLPQVFNALIDAIKVARMAGNSLSKAIEIARQELSDKFDSKDIDNAINAFAQKANIVVEKTQTEPKPVVEKENIKPVDGKRTAIERLKKGLTKDALSEKVKELNSTYNPSSQEQTERDAKYFIKLVGPINAIQAVKNREISTIGGLEIATMFYAKEDLRQIINDKSGQNIDENELKELVDIYFNAVEVYATLGTSGGQSISMINHLLKSQKEAYYQYGEVVNRFKQVNNGIVPKEMLEKLKLLTDLNEELTKKLEEAEAKEELRQSQNDLDVIVEEEKRQTKKGNTRKRTPLLTKAEAEQLAKKFDKLKIKRPGVFYNSIGPDLVWDGAIAVLQKSIITTGRLSEAITEAINYIKNSDWYKSLDNLKKKEVIGDFDDFARGNTTDVSIDENGKVNIPRAYLKKLISKGIVKIDDVIEKVKNDLQEQGEEGVLNRDIREAIVGYAKQARKTKSDYIAEINALKRIATLQNQIEDLENGIKATENPKKKAEKSELVKNLENQKKQLQDDLGITEEKREQRAEINALKRIAEIKEKIRTEDYAPRTLKPIPQNEDLKKLRREKNEVQEQLDKAIYKAELDNQSMAKKFIDVLINRLPDTLKKVMTTLEFSYIGIQGALLTSLSFFSPKTYLKIYKELGNTTAKDWKENPLKTFNKIAKVNRGYDAMYTMARAMFNSNYYENFEKALKELDVYEELIAVKLRVLGEDVRSQAKDELYKNDLISTGFSVVTDKITELTDNKEFITLQGRLEQITQKRVSEKNKKTVSEIFKNGINPFNYFERANNAYLNTIRVKTYLEYRQELINQGKNHIDNKEEFKKLASVVNTLSGSGNLNQKLEPSLSYLNWLMFSARLGASGANLSVAAPVYFVNLGNKSETGNIKDWRPSSAQKLFLRSILAQGVASTSLGLTVLYLINKEKDDEDEKAYIETDMRSSDFLKIVDGTVRHEFMPNFYRKWYVIMAQIASGETKTTKAKEVVANGSKFGVDNTWVKITKFTTNFLAPVPGIVSKNLQGVRDQENPETGNLFPYKTIRFGKNFEDVSILGQLERSAKPMIVNGFQEIAKDDKNVNSDLFRMLAIFGYNTQDYNKAKVEELPNYNK